MKMYLSIFSSRTGGDVVQEHLKPIIIKVLLLFIIIPKDVHSTRLLRRLETPYIRTLPRVHGTHSIAWLKGTILFYYLLQ